MAQINGTQITAQSIWIEKDGHVYVNGQRTGMSMPTKFDVVHTKHDRSRMDIGTQVVHIKK